MSDYRWFDDPADQLRAAGQGGGSGAAAGLGDNLALYSDGLTLPHGGGADLVIANEEFAVTGATFSHDGAGVITVNTACVVAVDAMIDFADASDATSRSGWIRFNGGTLTTEGGRKMVPAINGAATQIDLHNTVPVPAGTTITVHATQASTGDLGVSAEIEVTCLGHLAS